MYNHSFFYSKNYNKAKEQLEKGKAFLHHAMKIMNIPHTWKYVGFVCFPNLENKQTLIDAGAVKDEDELKVLIKTIHLIISDSLPFLVFRWF